MNCPGCGAQIVDRVALAAQATALLAALRAAYALLPLEGLEHEADRRAALRESLEQAGYMARDLARATTCAAGECRAAPVTARQPDGPGPYEALVRACLAEGPAPTCDLAEVLGRSVQFTDGLLHSLERHHVVVEEVGGEPPVARWALAPVTGDAAEGA